MEAASRNVAMPPEAIVNSLSDTGYIALCPQSGVVEAIIFKLYYQVSLYLPF